MKKKPTSGYPFFRVFPSDRVPKVTKDVNVHFFIHSSNYSKLYQRIPETYTGKFWEHFEATTYILSHAASHHVCSRSWP